MGAHVRGLSKTQVRSAAEARRAVELSMAARNDDPNVQSRSTLVLQLDVRGRPRRREAGARGISASNASRFFPMVSHSWSRAQTPAVAQGRTRRGACTW